MTDRPRDDLDAQFALGQIDIEEYRRRRDSVASVSRAKRGLPSKERHDQARGIQIVAVALVILTVVTGFLLAARMSPSISVSLSSPREMSQTDLDHLMSATNSTIYASNNTIWVGASVTRLVFLAAPPEHDEIFVVNGLLNPTIHVSKGSKLTITVVNADPGMYHNLALTTRDPAYSSMPMMNHMGGPRTDMLSPSENSYYWIQDMAITEISSGQYWYLCEYPNHANEGMYGSVIIS
ncbi:MAG TPA: multicopper oxidase domain-containing protein [Thermoplasmata archaeon]